MTKTKWQIWKEKNSGDVVRPWDIINPKIEKLPKKEYQKRLDICLGCDRLIKSTKQCKECGCFMNIKTQLPHASCPLGKWD
jgi:hypothetical protein